MTVFNFTAQHWSVHPSLKNSRLHPGSFSLDVSSALLNPREEPSILLKCIHKEKRVGGKQKDYSHGCHSLKLHIRSAKITVNYKYK